MFLLKYVPHCTCEDVYQKKFVQSKWLLYFGKYGYGGHVDIKCKSFNVPLIRFQMKRQIEVQKCHIFCSKLLSKIFLVNIFAGTVIYYALVCLGLLNLVMFAGTFSLNSKI